MGAALSSTVSLGVTYCCCNAAGSLCNACLGTTAPGTTGRKRSVLFLTIAVALALWFQYSVGPAIVSKSGWIWSTYRWIPGLGTRVYHAWHDSCAQFDTSKKNDDTALLHQCAGNAGVYRVTATAAVFFAAFAVATRVQPSLNREAWPAKYTIFLFTVALAMFVDSEPIFTGLWLWLARIGATVFVVLQQIILIDMAYNWNEEWVDRADQADRLDYGSGSYWLQAIVGTCVAFYITSMAVIVVLYENFGGCAENVWIITLTLLGILSITGIQLAGEEGSLLTSSVMSLYATYLAYSMVSKNPNGMCNPQLGSNDVWGIVIGLSLTALSLAWLGWSWTAEDRLSVEKVQTARSVNTSVAATSGQLNLDVPFLDPDDQPTSGFVMESGEGSSSRDTVGEDVWKLNVVMVLICCFVAMILTGWGTITRVNEEDNTAANPTVGRVNMAMIGISQWLAIGLYTWTLVAPRLFPDRDFN